MTVLRAETVAFSGLLVVLLSGAVSASAESRAATTGISSEAWYSTADACKEQVDCSLLPPPDAYPKDTLHVGITAGQTSAETYLELGTSTVPNGENITGGMLTLPVDTAPTDGSMRATEAQLVACLVTEFIDDSQGSFNRPPKYDCDTASSPAQFMANPNPAFTVDLATFATEWEGSGTPRLAIVPAPQAKQGNETWHVAFWGQTNKTKGAAPITAQLAYGSSSGDPDVVPTDTATAGLGEPVEADVAPAPAPPVDPAAHIAVPAPQAAEPPATDSPASAPALATSQPEAAPVLRAVGYPYPIAWTMPLLVLIGFVITGRALTKKLDLLP